MSRWHRTCPAWILMAACGSTPSDGGEERPGSDLTYQTWRLACAGHDQEEVVAGVIEDPDRILSISVMGQRSESDPELEGWKQTYFDEDRPARVAPDGEVTAVCSLSYDHLQVTVLLGP